MGLEREGGKESCIKHMYIDTPTQLRTVSSPSGRISEHFQGIYISRILLNS